MSASEKERMRVILGRMERCYGRGSAEYGDRQDPFRTLIGCVLSHRTRDENSAKAARALFETTGNPKDILLMDPEELKKRIRCSGFYNQKARNIRAICRVLMDDFEGVVPEDRDTLIGLPGVGPKTADIVLSHSFGYPAIAVDVHVANVAKRLGFVGPEADPERVKEALEELVSPELYRTMDNSFVDHGKAFCSSRNPKCDVCFIRNLCDYPKLGDSK